MLSTVSEEWVRGPELDVEYWWRNFREPVHFAQGVERLLKEGFSTFVEISPHPVLSGSVLECAGQRQQSAQVVPSLRRQEDERTTMLKGLGTLFTLGAPIDWQPLTMHGRLRLAALCTPWQRKSYWHEGEVSRRLAVGSARPSVAGRPHGCCLAHLGKPSRLERLSLPRRPQGADSGGLPDHGVPRNGPCGRSTGAEAGPGDVRGNCKLAQGPVHRHRAIHRGAERLLPSGRTNPGDSPACPAGQ